MDEKHYIAALYWRAYRRYKTAMLKDARDDGEEVEAAINWYAWYRLYVDRTGTLPPPPPCH